MKDYLGHEVTVTPADWRPRNGQWVLFSLRDLSKQAELVRYGAHAARDGSLVAIFQDVHVTPVLRIKNDSGSEQSGGNSVPARLVLVGANGHNLPIGVRNDTGGMTVADVFFFPESPNVINLRPLDHLGDMPPDRVIHTQWAEAIHNENRHENDHLRLSDETHAQGQVTVAAALIEAATPANVLSEQ